MYRYYVYIAINRCYWRLIYYISIIFMNTYKGAKTDGQV